MGYKFIQGRGTGSFQKIHNVSWAPWVNETMFQTLRELEALSLDLKYSDSGVARLKGGSCLYVSVRLAKIYTIVCVPS